MVILLFGLEALFTRDSRVLFCAVSSSPKLKAAIGYFSDQTQFLLAPTAIRLPVGPRKILFCSNVVIHIVLHCLLF